MLNSTTAKAKEHEEYVAKTFSWDNAKRSRSSGAALHDPIDITSDSCVIEAEYTENKSYRLKLEFWQEVVGKQYNGKMPILAVRFRDAKSTDLGIVDLNDLSALLEEVEAYRLEALHGNSVTSTKGR
jgi:hypothetical protein